jgi:hypothetical protein
MKIQFVNRCSMDLKLTTLLTKTYSTYIIERSNDNSTTTTAACLQLRFVWLQFCVKLVHFGIYRPLLLSSCYIGDRWGRVLQHLVHICV